MKSFADYKEIVVPKGSAEKLPVGGYALKVLNVRYENGQDGNSDCIIFMFDITEGEYKDFFKKQYESNTSEDRKWKGTVVLYVPKDDGSEADGWAKQKFKRYMEAFEDSNPGYTWNWDENTLKGKAIGGVFGEVLTTIEGKDVSYVKMKYATSVDAIRKGSFKIPEVQDKRSSGSVNSSSSAQPDFLVVPEDAEIPFG